ncbi:hypothetical protein CLU79DRAFT_846338 [Phycomyces nitens]|nr:hypothetical protein CLU79DRAFT_846338 [Phycomyces nitens]
MAEIFHQSQIHEDDSQDSDNDSWSPRIKHRRRFSANEAALLEQQYAEEQSPSQHVLQNLADQMSTPRKTITTWFQNRRAKHRRRSYRNKKSCKKVDDLQQSTDGFPGQRMSDNTSDIETNPYSSSSSLLLVEGSSPDLTSMKEDCIFPQNMFDDGLGALAQLPSTPDYSFDYHHLWNPEQISMMYTHGGYDYLGREQPEDSFADIPGLYAWARYNQRNLVHPSQNTPLFDTGFTGSHRESNVSERINFPRQPEQSIETTDYEWREQFAPYLMKTEDVEHWYHV